jgi:hypothetical protein
MLTIREEQRQVFRRQRIEDYVQRVSMHIASEYPDDYARLTADGTRGLIHTAIETGAKHGITGEGSVLNLVELMIEFGRQFELSPDRNWALTILAHRDLPGSVKVQVIGERQRERTGGRRIVKLPETGAEG